MGTPAPGPGTSNGVQLSCRPHHRHLTVVLIVILVAVGLGGCGGEGRGRDASAPGSGVDAGGTLGHDVGGSGTEANCDDVDPVLLSIDVIRRVPNDVRSYTQGLLIHDGVVYESSGRYGQSGLRTVDPTDGTTLDSVSLPEDVFGEGIAVTGDDELIQLTWKEGRAFRWRVDDFDVNSAPFAEFTYEGEGWGLTTLANGNLLMSDGSDRLVERDPSDFEVIRTYRVGRVDGPTDMLNELEFDGTWVWANRYQSDEILRIDPRCFTVTGVADLQPLREEAVASAQLDGSPIDVANGIAYDPATGHYLLAGKLWPVSFEVSFSEGSH